MSQIGKKLRTLRVEPLELPKPLRKEEERREAPVSKPNKRTPAPVPTRS